MRMARRIHQWGAVRELHKVSTSNHERSAPPSMRSGTGEPMSTAVAPVNEQVSKFIASPRKMLINGKWVDSVSGKTFPTYDPATGKEMAYVAEGDKADVNLAVTAARNAFDKGPWRKMTASERGRLIWKLGDLLEKNIEEFAQLESIDNG